MSRLPTQEELQAAFAYNPETGIFTRLTTGRIANCARGDNYDTISFAGENRLAHRMAWLYMTGNLPKADIDHIDRDGHNNSWGNLREATRSQNLMNKSRGRKNKALSKNIVWVERLNRY